ncbi:hypervirulence associated TUDOR domain-containing protein [Alteromonas oceanisediminis]|uniref:DUF2945 domain-containing protein n=1 Tax=Alteromonas oceanisediminis TaxID=2836180 RepID=UPI001BD9F2CB|nr:DUF2945 domain-containing protein [Alteromonas oceanisediminis]MBT0586681.1 HVA1 family protein [Alteromonas oceanisediminis]
MKNFPTNTKVTWEWGQGTASGYVREKFTESVTKTIDGNEVTRDADENNPAYLLEQDDGQRVLKSASELKKAN